MQSVRHAEESVFRHVPLADAVGYFKLLCAHVTLQLFVQRARGVRQRKCVGQLFGRFMQLRGLL